MPPRKLSPVGVHLKSGGAGLTRALPYAHGVGAQALQVFVSNPRGWAASDPGPAADEATREAVGAMPLFVHAPYLVNLASPAEVTRANSLRSLEFTLVRAQRLGARGVVLHAGSAVEPGTRALGLDRLRAALMPLLDAGERHPPLLLEPTAGGGEPLACDVEDLASVFAALDSHPRLGVCLDTCHAYAGGADLAAPGGVRRWLNGLVGAVGRGRLHLVHANDSRDPLGSRRDRHARIGTGSIGAEPFGELFRHPATAGVPVVLETPGESREQAHDVALLKALRDR
ncbi:MAG: deoxyribonuclease IV [Mycobacteriales bacterium]